MCKHQPATDKWYTRCSLCMKVMSRAKIGRGGYPVPSKSGKYRITSSVLATVLAGPTWEY